MPEDNATAASLAAADQHLQSLSLLAGIFSSSIERARRDLRQVRSDAEAAQKHENRGHAVPSDISPEMLAG
jgi:septal ring factor EnvC (AmiA/AmiB activator)